MYGRRTRGFISERRMRRKRSHSFSAFTLVELLVVIGLIALLIGILLPVLSGIQSRARDLQRQSNIRQCVNLILMYSSENSGQLPYGYYFVHGGRAPDSWGPVPTPEGLHYSVTLWSVVSRMSSKSHNFEDPNYDGSGQERLEAQRNAAPVLRCPEAMQVLPHLSSYAGNLATFIVPYADAVEPGASREGSPWSRLVEKQTTITRCFPITALVWDTAVTPGMGTKIGYVVGLDLDDQRIWNGAVHPQYRYYSNNDPFSLFPPGTYGNNKPIVMRVQNRIWRNIDPPPENFFEGWENMAFPPYEGNLRFRHNKNTTCNVGFADGHVGQFRGRFKSDGGVVVHDALRKHFLVKWPSGMGIAPDPGLPY